MHHSAMHFLIRNILIKAADKKPCSYPQKFPSSLFLYSTQNFLSGNLLKTGIRGLIRLLTTHPTCRFIQRRVKLQSQNPAQKIVQAMILNMAQLACGSLLLHTLPQSQAPLQFARADCTLQDALICMGLLSLFGPLPNPQRDQQ